MHPTTNYSYLSASARISGSHHDRSSFMLSIFHNNTRGKSNPGPALDLKIHLHYMLNQSALRTPVPIHRKRDEGAPKRQDINIWAYDQRALLEIPLRRRHTATRDSLGHGHEHNSK